MATVRKYPKPKGYFRGGRVLQDVSIEGDAPETGLVDNPVSGFPAEILGDHLKEHDRAPVSLESKEANRADTAQFPADENPLQRALDAQRRADELQQSTLDREIGKLPLSEFKKSFLRLHPELVTDEFRAKALGFYHQQALTAGIADDTPEMNAAILQGVDREIAHVRQQAIENVRMPAVSEPEPAPPPAPQTERAPPLMPPPPPTRRVPMSAPVTRESYSYSGKTHSESSSVTLSAEERDIARRSYSAPGMTDAQKEYEYGKNKLRLKRLRQSGEYPESERN